MLANPQDAKPDARGDEIRSKALSYQIMKEYTNIGKRIIVFWTDKAYRNRSDWASFLIIDECQDGMYCQGVTSPDGTPHDGSKTFIRNNEINDWIEWKEEQ
jgi:hypothetical protein